MDDTATQAICDIEIANDSSSAEERVTGRTYGPKIFVRGLGAQPGGAWVVERMPSHAELMALSLDERVDAIWISGVSPTSPELRAAFESCVDAPGRGMFIAAAAMNGQPVAGMWFVGERRFDLLTWPDGPPQSPFSRRRQHNDDHAPKQRQRQRRAPAEAIRSGGLFSPLDCGCFDFCDNKHALDPTDEAVTGADITSAIVEATKSPHPPAEGGDQQELALDGAPTQADFDALLLAHVVRPSDP